MNAPKLCVTLFLSMALPGCALHRLEPPTPRIDLPAEFRSLPERSTSLTSSNTGRWWSVFGDGQLDTLIDRALAGSPDVEMARARIAAARARSGSIHAGTRPALELGASAHREQLSENGLFGAATRNGAFPDLYSQYRSGIDASWEIDLFGAQAARRRSAQADEDVALADLDVLRLSLPAEIARLYVDHVVSSQQASSLQRALQAGERRLALLSQRHSQGDLSEQALVAARRDVAELRVRLPGLIASRESIRHAMGALIGTGEYVVLPESSPILNTATTLLDGAVAIGTPSDLLRRRPDIHSAEARFQSAFAEQRYAIADQYPRFTLIGSLGLESLKSGDLLSAASKAWSLTPQLSLPLLDGGRRRAFRRLRDAELDESVADYRKTVIAALVDVEQSLLAQRAARQSLVAQQARLEDAQRLLRIATARVNHGEASQSDVLQSEADCEYAFAQTLVEQGEALTQYVRLQKALGGPAS